MSSFLGVGLVICVIFVADSQCFSTRNRRSEKKGEKSLLDIYQQSMPSVMGMKSYNGTLELLLDTYLSEKKEDSIWPKVMKETEVWFGETQDRDDLERMQEVLRKFRRTLVNCHEENTGKELSRCLDVLKHDMVSGENEFFWGKEQEIPLYLNFYEAFHLMKLATLQLFKIQLEKNEIKGVSIDQSIIKEARSFSETLKKSVGKVCEQRIQMITAVQLCKVVDVMWEEFTENCEERLRRSVSEDEVREEASGEDADAGQRTITESDLGGKQTDFHESLRGIVKDRTTEEFIYNRRLDVTSMENKAKLLDQLYNEARKARGEHVDRVKNACEKYWKKRGTEIADQVEKLVEMPKKKADKKKKEDKKDDEDN